MACTYNALTLSRCADTSVPRRTAISRHRHTGVTVSGPSQLSTELLIMIFKMFILLHNNYAFNSNIHKPVPHLTLSHVCRKWRHIIHNLPEVWTLVDTRAIELMEMSMVLSRKLPLQLRVVEPYGKHARPLDNWLIYVTPDKHRFHSLEYWPRPEQNPVERMDLITWFMDNAINLRSVTYFAASAPFSPVLTFNPNERVNPPPVAQLCCYGFQGVAALTAYCSTTLTCLQLHGTRCYPYTPRAGAAEAQELFHALNSAPNLIHLHLTQIVFAHQSDTIPSVTLNKLQLLTITDSSWSMVQMLNFVRIPTSAQLQLEVRWDDPATFLKYMPLLHQSLADKFSGPEIIGYPAEYHRLLLEFMPVPRISAWTKDNSQTSYFKFTFHRSMQPTPVMKECYTALLMGIVANMRSVRRLDIGLYAPLAPFPDDTKV